MKKIIILIFCLLTFSLGGCTKKTLSNFEGTYKYGQPLAIIFKDSESIQKLGELDDKELINTYVDWIENPEEIPNVEKTDDSFNNRQSWRVDSDDNIYLTNEDSTTSKDSLKNDIAYKNAFISVNKGSNNVPNNTYLFNKNNLFVIFTSEIQGEDILVITKYFKEDSEEYSNRESEFIAESKIEARKAEETSKQAAAETSKAEESSKQAAAETSKAEESRKQAVVESKTKTKEEQKIKEKNSSDISSDKTSNYSSTSEPSYSEGTYNDFSSYNESIKVIDEDIKTALVVVTQKAVRENEGLSDISWPWGHDDYNIKEIAPEMYSTQGTFEHKGIIYNFELIIIMREDTTGYIYFYNVY
ncbi:hypothetical protein ACUW9Z_000732 [Aerococcus sp. 150760007-1]|uniref:Cell envelope integrity protein TolA n=1 Tax=Aerococcus urinaeequi TaxID=51665 RepID=A0ABR5ZXJ3_9LACT|nr:cell envelope integrity protein TolA [Aerococcus urinaeequi]MBA5746433.1 cell envelope integrity protein TolA [Aerococcus urinaeequi]MBA5829217.1 cell envelope integrity protein TolA [Aerococcus urinaeequi]MBA5860174.1 cell envelope integrity protein TolA [Aerococcus urinaeequi]